MDNSYECIKKITETVIKAENAEIIDVKISEQGNSCVLKVIADKNGGILLDECVRINRLIRLEIEETFKSLNIAVEVSSPGLDRVLKSEDDFKKVLGKIVRIITRIPVNNKVEYGGKILAADDGIIILEMGNGQNMKIPITEIKRAKLEIRW
ncbi:MAG: hypothetical protein HY810_02165 [Candidatus Omnitrophica bacterium]|nr:hypothetical protein [Candidatus Omnitrophota bacterium]